MGRHLSTGGPAIAYASWSEVTTHAYGDLPFPMVVLPEARVCRSRTPPRHRAPSCGLVRMSRRREQGYHWARAVGQREPGECWHEKIQDQTT